MNKFAVLGVGWVYFMCAFLFRDNVALAIVFSTSGFVMFGILAALAFGGGKD